MSASPAVMARTSDQMPSDGSVAIPAKWRMFQFIAIGTIGVLALLYALMGWRSPRGESGLADAFRPVDLMGFLVLAGLAWLTTPSAFVIARTTFQEAIRRRWMLGLLGFGIVLMLLSTTFSWMRQGEEKNFLRDFGLGFIIIITMLMAIFLGAALVPPEIERRTIFTVLSKPVDRLEFLIGKFLGLCCTLFVNMALMGAMFLLSYALVMIRREGAAAWNVLLPSHPGLAWELTQLARALLLQFSEIIVMAALALALSLMMSGIVAIVSAFLVYFAGQMAAYWEHMREGGSRLELALPLQGALTLIYYLLPKFDKFDVRERLVNNMPVGINYWWPAFGSGLVYAAILLAIAYAVFSDREF